MAQYISGIHYNQNELPHFRTKHLMHNLYLDFCRLAKEEKSETKLLCWTNSVLFAGSSQWIISKKAEMKPELPAEIGTRLPERKDLQMLQDSSTVEIFN